MADFKDFLSTDGYLARLTRMNEIKTALAQWLSVGSHSNVPEGAIRWSPAQKRWEVYTGGTWGVLETEYNVNVKQLQGAEPNTAVSNNSIVKRTATGQVKAAAPSTNDEVTTRAFSDSRYVRQADLGESGGLTVENAAKLGGQLPAYYRNANNINAGTLPLARGGTGATSAGAARASLGFTLSAPMLARLNAGKDHSLQDWQDGEATEGGLISPAQLAEAAGDKTAIGTVSWFALSTPPDGWLVCDGRAITNLYPDLRQALIDDGFPWGQDGSGNPLIPDLVEGNRFLRAAGGSLPVGTYQEDAIGPHEHTIYLRGNSSSGQYPGIVGAGNQGPWESNVSGSVSSTTYNSPGQGDETRPKSAAALVCIKAFGSAVNIPGQADLDYIIDQARNPVGLDADTLDGMHASEMLGAGTVWRDKTGSRVGDVWYENTLPTALEVAITAYRSGGRGNLHVRHGTNGDSLFLGGFDNYGSTVSFFLPPGWQCRVSNITGTIHSWMERSQ